VQAILCHANVSTTMAHYVIADPAEQRAAISKLDGVPDCLWNLKKGTEFNISGEEGHGLELENAVKGS
jgi:hypothetical protein